MSQFGDQTELPPPPPLRTRGVGEILSAAVDLYGRYWRTLLPLVAVVVIPLSILQYGLAEATRVERVGELSAEEAVGAGFGWLVIWLGSLFFTILVTGAVAWAVAGILVRREPDLGESYRFGLARFWSIVLVGILTALAVLGGLILLIIPAFIFFTRFSVSVPVLVVEGRRGTNALSRSWDLVTGHSWPVFGTLLVAAMLSGLVSAVLTLPFAGWFVQGLLAGIASTITTPFFALVLALIYFDLRVRKENLDVAGLDAELRASAP
ncbi:MAG TPA: hypothetical protein VFZ96_03460 [Actinomycetota bacterium]|nr:hypothetical protein [Actinomycetota bacterium]